MHGVFFPFTQSCYTYNVLVFLDPDNTSIEEAAVAAKVAAAEAEAKAEAKAEAEDVAFVCCVMKKFIINLKPPLLPKSVIKAYKPGTIRMARNYC